MTKRWLAVLVWLSCSVGASLAAAKEACLRAGSFVSIEGEVSVRRDGAPHWEPAALHRDLCEGDSIAVRDHSRAAVQLINSAVLRIDQNTELRLMDVTDDPHEASWLDLGRGALQSFSRYPQRLKIDTRHLRALIDGTEFLVQATDDMSRLLVLEGKVTVSNASGKVTVSPGTAALAQAGRAPALETVVRPRDAVQWALYYPPILAVMDGRSRHRHHIPADPRESAALYPALELMRRGKFSEALDSLDRIAMADRGANVRLYRAALLLAAGRVPDALREIDSALGREPGQGLAYALRSIIAVVQNHPREALRDAEHGVALSPSAAARIALSYAQQANFDLEKARDTLLLAVKEHPADALAWARLGEIWLMLGDRRQALRAVEQATLLSPDSARAQLVLGFCELAAFRNRAARSAFEHGIALAPADPLLHLGLGLSRISAGELEPGRREIEVAVGLNSNSALLRSYLGKAYFEEKRYPLDTAQYGLAKTLDPLDPTAYLYDGILKQSVNRPVEALRDLQAAIDRNRQRAVYRSRLLLDADRAARTTSWARALNDLGFLQLGIIESGFSLSLDPSNPGAHRFLSDTYRDFRRREIARVSELLQAQLMQDININPIQPTLAETNLNIITMGGPATPGFNEFTPLFERNKVQFNGTGFGGTHNTYGGEGMITALYDRFSFSAGGYHYNSDGWRPNNQLNQSIVDAFGQAALTPELNLQAEFRRRESSEGDLEFNFDPNNFLRDKTVQRDQTIARLGLRYQPTPGSNLLFSYIHSSRGEQLQQTQSTDPMALVSIASRASIEGDQFEGQHIFQRDAFNVIGGFGYSQVSSRNPSALTFHDPNGRAVDGITDYAASTAYHPRGYLYSNINFPKSAIWTLGFSYDQYTEAPFEKSSFNPKFGIQWDVNRDFRLRAAAFRVLKPALVNDRTIEPTQIAGFNQYFDDIDATGSTRYAGGFNWRPAPDLFIGGEVTWRSLAEPLLRVEADGRPVAKVEDRSEALHNFYLYWTLFDNWAVKADFIYDRYASQQGVATEFDNLPEWVETLSVPIAVSYFHESGIFASVGGSFVDQTVRRSPNSSQADGSDRFFLADATVGYRFPKRLGILNIGVKNLFNSTFQYQDNSYREFRNLSSIGPYFPERIVIARFTLSF